MLPHHSKFLLAAVALAGATAFATPLLAAGDGNSPVTPTCSSGKVWDKSKKKCVTPQQSGQLDDDNIYEAARDLAYNRRYEEAIKVLQLAQNKQDPRILNYLGYSHRKLGQVEAGLTYYTAALKEDPNYTLVREYMGEAFLQLGRVDKALAQLTEIEKRCGRDCREYSMLEQQIHIYTTN